MLNKNINGIRALVNRIRIAKAKKNLAKETYTGRKNMFTLKKNVRTILIIASCSVAAIAFIVCVVTIVFPNYQLVDKVIAQAQAESKIDYEVHLKDNPIYEKDVLSESNYYLKPFTEYVDMDCTFNIESDNPVEINTINGVDVFLISQLGLDDNVEEIWQKKYTYAMPASNYSDNGELSFTRHVKLDFDDLDTLVTRLVNEFELLTDYIIKVKFYVTATTSYDGKVEETPIDVELTIPFTNSIYTIDGATTNSQTIEFVEKTNERLGVNMNRLAISLAVLLTSCGILLLLLLKTENSVDKDEFEIETSKIFKEYGDRLAGLSETLAYQSSVMISINRIKDMVKIADEIGQTVFYYRVEEENERKIEFYVFDEGRIYYMVIFGQL